MLLLSPCFFVASPPFLLLSASKRCYPVVSFAYRTFDVWPHRRRQRRVVVFLRRRYRPLLSFFSCSFFRVVRGAGGSGSGGYLAAAISGFISCIISLVISPLSLPPLSRPAIEVATSRRCHGSQERLDGGGGGFQLPPAVREEHEHRLLKLFLFQSFCSFHLNAPVLCVCVYVSNTPPFRLCDFHVRASSRFDATPQQMAAVLGAAARKLKRSAAGEREGRAAGEVAGM